MDVFTPIHLDEQKLQQKINQSRIKILSDETHVDYEQRVRGMCALELYDEQENGLTNMRSRLDN